MNKVNYRGRLEPNSHTDRPGVCCCLAGEGDGVPLPALCLAADVNLGAFKVQYANVYKVNSQLIHIQ